MLFSQIHVAMKLSGDDKQPVAWDLSQGQIVRFDGTSWVPVTAFATTTTTSTSSTTTTTTIPYR